jgi:multiple sugar transport system permease protein
MPIISTIGRRSTRVRLVLAAIYGVLALGALSMLYPLLLMMSGSVKSEADFRSFTPLPQYLWDDELLWMKYVESKYATLPNAEAAVGRTMGTWRNVRLPSLDAAGRDDAELFRQFRAQTDWPREWFTLGHAQSDKILAANARLFRREAQRRFHGSITEYSNAVGVRYPSWSHVGPPAAPFAARRFTFPDTASYRIYDYVKAIAPRADWVVINLDGDFRTNYLWPLWATIEEYNRAHGTQFGSYDEVLLATRAPPGGQARADWEEYVRNQLGLAFVRVDASTSEPFLQFLRTRFANIAELNRLWGSNYTRFEQVPLPQGIPSNTRAQIDFAEFVKDAKLCPLNALSVYGPRQAFEAYTAKTTPSALPIEAVDYLDFLAQRGPLRREFLTRNYVAVWDYLWLHGNAFRNTLIFCTLLVLTNLIVNPLAAYALSRYKLPSTYTILLFCMATMAFPVEVTMIPSFLLLRRFPLCGLLIGAVAVLVVAWLLQRVKPNWPEGVKGVVAGGAGLGIGFILGRELPNVSLLNTFWALVLPGMANGFSIFLLKGFFDSLPQELYEAAEIDGAGEWSKFWIVTMSLSKPILAVLALGAFTVAYSEFMMALIIVPDPRMWTIMVWLFQLQTFAHPSVIYASLVVAMIPTLLMFLLCQRFIVRGIVVPVEK